MNGTNNNMTDDTSRPMASESGKAISWAILLCAAVAGSYYAGGKEVLEQNLSPFFQTLVVLSSVLVCFASLGCGLHLFFLGGRSNTELRHLIKEHNDTLVQLVREGTALIHSVELGLGRMSLKLSPRGLDALSMARRLTNALNKRTEEISYLLSTKSSADLIDADELLRKKLIITENATESLIGAEPVPPLAPEEWVSSLKRLFTDIENERKKTA